MDKPYHERPDWILKSIVYFCDNYTINGKPLSKEKTIAIKTYKNGAKPLTRISNTVSMASPPCWDFWDCLAWLHGYWEYPEVGIINCAPWTNYEKRKIAKLPEVK